MIQMLFTELRFTAHAASPIIVLTELNGDRVLPIWASAAAGAAIVSAMEAENVEHPVTHDLLLDLLSTLDAAIENVTIIGCHEGVFDAQVRVNGTAVTCRPSDGIALALRGGAPILAAEAVLAEYAITPADLDEQTPDAEADEVKQFREFLANVRAEDFEQPDS